jgi:iron complex outermembrane recepter protein
MSNSVKKHLVLAVAMTIPGVAFSQALEEIVVTAQKRAQSAQDVPISITAMSSDFIEDRGIASATDLEKFTPGLRIPQQDASKTFIRIRGVGSRKFDIGAAGSVGVFTDEVYMPRFSGADIGFLDIERIEVLKGPQGTLFGRNTAAGAISSWTRKPSYETEGFIEAGVGNEDSYLTRGAISGPVTDNVAMRLSLGHEQRGGFQANTLSGNSDDSSNTTARLQAMIDASDTLMVQAFLQFNNRQQDALLQKNIALGTEDGQIVPLFLAPGVQAFDNGDFRDYPVSDEGDFDYDTWVSYLRVEKEFENFQLVSLTSYLDGNGTTENDFDSAEVSVGASAFEEDYDTFSQELRFVGEQWLAGGYYYLDDAYSDYKFSWLEDSLPAFLWGGNIFDNAPLDMETTSWAVFGEYRIDFSERLSLTLGGRYSVDEIDFTRRGITSAPGMIPTVKNYTYSDKQDWDSFDPKVSLTFQATDDLMAYFTYSEGYKAGGTQFTAPNLEVASQLFDPEELDSYEVGVKSELFDRTLRLNASLFYYDYQDLQVQRVDTVLSGGLPVAFTSNAAESEITGFEFDLLWAPLEGLNVRFAYSYLDTEYNDFIGPAGEDFSGNPLPVSPENTVMGSLDYTTEVSGGWSLTAGTDWVWIDDFNFDVTDDDPYTKGGDYTLGSVRLALISPEENWRITAYADNVTDEEEYANKTRRSQEVIAAALDGRRYGVRVQYNF